MPGIEFLDDDGNVLDDPGPAREVTRRPVLGEVTRSWPAGSPAATAAALAAPVLWVAAAVVGVVACFHKVYDERIKSGALYAQGMDGWGRFSHRGDVSVASHGVRYGELVCVAAGALVVAAVLQVLRPRAATPVALGGAAALLGVVATVWLSVRNDYEQIRAAFNRQGMLRPQVLELRYGAFLWLGLVAVAIAVAGWALAVFARGTSARTDAAAGVDLPAGTATPADPAALPEAVVLDDVTLEDVTIENVTLEDVTPAGPPAGPHPAQPLFAGTMTSTGEANLTVDDVHSGPHDELLGTRNG